QLHTLFLGTHKENEVFRRWGNNERGRAILRQNWGWADMGPTDSAAVAFHEIFHLAGHLKDTYDLPVANRLEHNYMSNDTSSWRLEQFQFNQLNDNKNSPRYTRDLDGRVLDAKGNELDWPKNIPIEFYLGPPAAEQIPYYLRKPSSSAGPITGEE